MDISNIIARHFFSCSSSVFFVQVDFAFLFLMAQKNRFLSIIHEYSLIKEYGGEQGKRLDILQPNEMLKYGPIVKQYFFGKFYSLMAARQPVVFVGSFKCQKGKERQWKLICSLCLFVHCSWNENQNSLVIDFAFHSVWLIPRRTFLNYCNSNAGPLMVSFYNNIRSLLQF